MKLYKFKRLIYVILFILVFEKIFTLIAHAETPVVDTSAGKIVFTVTDKTATSGIRFKTVGFTITKNPCKPRGGDPRKQEYGTLYLDNPHCKKESDPQSNGYTKTTFTFDRDYVSQALYDGGLGHIKENDTFYMHGIHQVTHDGKNYGKVKYTLPEIKNAEPWADPSSFDDRFDIEVVYKGAPEPIEIEYKTSGGKIIATEKYPGNSKLKPVKPGTQIKLSLDMKKNYNGEEYELYKSYIDYLTINKPIPNTGLNLSNSTIDKIQNRVIEQKVGGVRFVAIMKLKKEDAGEDPETSDEIINELIEPSPHGIIAADYRNNEKYEVTDGIPTTENLYVNAFTSNYLLGYKLKKVTGTKTYPVTVKKTYHLSWETSNPPDANGNPTPPTHHTGSETVTKTVNVERKYSYWIIGNLDYFGIKNAKVNNYALPGGSITLNPKGYTPPGITQVHKAKVEDHIKDPTYNKTLNLSGSLSGGSSRPSIPNESFQSEANGVVPEIKVKNDKFIFDGSTILSDEYTDTKTIAPKMFEIDTEEVDENVLYESTLKIAAEKANGEYNTTGTMTYQRIDSVNPEFGEQLTYDIAELNNVVIHTPTVCDATIHPSKEYNQMLFPDASYNPLVLDRYFKINLTTEGDHRYIKGYGYNDYDKYIDRRQVKFPFDVYKDNTYIKAGTWHTLTSDITTFYMPIWVDEGKYTIQFRSISINADANNGMSKTEDLANLNLSNYVATDSTNVEVSGRVYGFNLYDITDCPMWETVFRQPNSAKHTGFYYPVGTNDRNGSNTGINSQFTLPLVNGSHPAVRNIGIIKTGYVTRFSLSTIGNMSDPNDYIRIIPKFYYVDKQGKNRQEVDIYYSETFSGKKQELVKMGSDRDLQNKKALRLGEVYRSVPKTEIATTARIKKVTENELKGVKKNVFTFTNMMIPENMRTYIGTDYTPTGTVPAGVNPDKVTQSKQRWYGEYYFPSEIHAAPKGFNVIQYGRDHYGIDYKESFWLKNGYVIVNFDIETINNDKRSLSYINKENSPHGYCNMWNMEGYQYSKTDDKGNVFEFIDGDYILYSTDDSASKDYIFAGTH